MVLPFLSDFLCPIGTRIDLLLLLYLYIYLFIYFINIPIFFRFFTMKAGLNYLRHEESRRATGPLAFVKENVGTFLDAVDTLISILADKLCVFFLLIMIVIVLFS